jgi:RecB family exonuclease
LVLSPSQAQIYENCPRRYVLERRLKVGSDTSLHAGFGTLIHDVLENVERVAQADGRDHATVDEALTELESRFDPDDFGGRPFADSWLERGRDGLTRLYGKWPARKRRAIALERTLEAEVGGIRWTGRADRIDIGPGGLIVVDYKTSRSALQVAEAAESLQLGFYALAVGRDGHLSDCGPVIGAELWYPMAATKSVTTRKFDMALLGDVETRLEAVARGISAEDWTPTPGTLCERCSLRQVCPAWPEGGPGFA